MPTASNFGLNLIQRLKFKRKVAENNIKCYSFQKDTKYIERRKCEGAKKNSADFNIDRCTRTERLSG